MLKNIIKVLLSNTVLATLGILNGVLYPVLLSVNDYAYYQEYMLYIGYVNICHLGVASGMFLNYAGKKHKDTDRAQYKSEIYLIYIILAVFSAVGLIFTGVQGDKLFLLVALTIFPQCIIASFQALYQAWERFTAYSIVNTLPKVLFTICIVVAYLLFQSVSGSTLVIIYLIIMWTVSLYFVFEFTAFTKGVKHKKIFSKENIHTTGNGFLITLGNYVNLLFYSIDKQFVNILYNTTSFAIYSFAMSLQSIMLIFITALANPFYPRLARGDIDSEQIGLFKKMLFAFGAYSGCAYFAVSFFVKHFVTKYILSLEVVAMFFAVFPAMAVINVLYINMYKIKKMLKKYIFTLVGMIGVSVMLNVISVLFHGDYIGISFATMVSYYIWLLYSQRDFVEISIEKRDYVYLFGYFALYYLTIKIPYDFLGFFVYLVLITVWNLLMYREVIGFIKEYVIKLIRR